MYSIEWLGYVGSATEESKRVVGERQVEIVRFEGRMESNVASRYRGLVLREGEVGWMNVWI